jgi:hypothetical protein
MKKKMVFSVVIEPEHTSADLSPLAGQWSVGVDVRLTNPAQFVRGPIESVFLDMPSLELPTAHESPAPEVKPDSTPGERAWNERMREVLHDRARAWEWLSDL